MNMEIQNEAALFHFWDFVNQILFAVRKMSEKIMYTDKKGS
jgi:hypothetical protein